MDITSHLYGHLRKDKYVGVEDLYQFAHAVYPADENFAAWVWKTILRDLLYFMYLGGGQGRPYIVDAIHRITGQTRPQWYEEIEKAKAWHRFSEFQEPDLWLISIDSLREYYHHLYVHDRQWRCTDTVSHTGYRWTMSPEEFDHYRSRNISDLDEWHEQAKRQDINPCVYSLLYWWVVTGLRMPTV
jgi:hypothetical protein